MGRLVEASIRPGRFRSRRQGERVEPFRRDRREIIAPIVRRRRRRGRGRVALMPPSMMRGGLGVARRRMGPRHRAGRVREEQRAKTCADRPTDPPAADGAAPHQRVDKLNTAALSRIWLDSEAS